MWEEKKGSVWSFCAEIVNSNDENGSDGCE